MLTLAVEASFWTVAIALSLVSNMALRNVLLAT